jgi:hypothetical protein
VELSLCKQRSLELSRVVRVCFSLFLAFFSFTPVRDDAPLAGSCKAFPGSAINSKPGVAGSFFKIK